MSLTDRILQVLDRAEEFEALQVVIVPDVGVRFVYQGWHFLRLGTDYLFTVQEMADIDQPPEGREVRYHSVLLNYRDPETAVMATVWNLNIDGGFIRLGALHNSD